MSDFAFETLAITAGQAFDPTTGAVVPPVYLTTTFVQDGIGGFRNGYEYARGGNPTRDSLQELLASLEGGSHAFSFASGLSAEDAVLRATLAAGDHILMGNDVYGGTHRLVNRVFVPWGVSLSTADFTDLDAVQSLIGASLPLIGVHEPLSAAKAALAQTDALLVTTDGKPAAVLTRHDLLTFLSH